MDFSRFFIMGIFILYIGFLVLLVAGEARKDWKRRKRWKKQEKTWLMRKYEQDRDKGL